MIMNKLVLKRDNLHIYTVLCFFLSTVCYIVVYFISKCALIYKNILPNILEKGFLALHSAPTNLFDGLFFFLLILIYTKRFREKLSWKTIFEISFIYTALHLFKFMVEWKIFIPINININPIVSNIMIITVIIETIFLFFLQIVGIKIFNHLALIYFNKVENKE